MRDSADPARVSALSDGVFAVLITVLVLDLRPPATPTRYAKDATSRLIWFNFAHLFSMSLLPVSTAWMATSALAPQPVSFYAAVFFLVNVTYTALIWELIGKNPSAEASSRVRRLMQWRSMITLCLFGGASVVALAHPSVGLSICILCLAVYLKPDPVVRR